MLAFVLFKILCLNVCCSSVFLRCLCQRELNTITRIAHAYKMLVGMLKLKRQLGRQRHKWENNIKIVITLF